MKSAISRRRALQGGLTAASLALFPWSAFSQEDPASKPIPFLDPQPKQARGKMVHWENLQEWITPVNEFFAVSHYGTPKINESQWLLEITGAIKHSQSYNLTDLKRRPRRELVATLECSGNGSSPGFMGAVGNARWAGTLLAPLLDKAGVKKGTTEVVFFGADEKTEKIRDQEYTQNFARSLSLDEIKEKEVLLAYEMNGQPLTADHGFPLRLIVPGWYGVAWVKWLKRIEIHPHRYMSKFMARDYVTIRGEERNGEMIWRETSVGRMNVKSLVARARRQEDFIRFEGAAWSDGTPIERVEMKLNGGEWVPARLVKNPNPHAWTFFTWLWEKPVSGEHTIVSRAIDTRGRVQPSKEDPAIKLKKTYWEANQQVVRRFKV